jgi:hypothetical protein
VLYDENGNRVFEPSDARRFYLADDNILVSILEDGDNSAVKVYLSTNIQISEVLEFVTVLRRIATQFNVLFNLRKYNKKIEPKDFATQAAIQEQKEYSMNIMEGLYGTSKSSYLKLENARMIVRHSARVKENMIGGRGRAIQSIFVENALGERFLFPVNVLSGARAMTQHVNHGGTFADEVGQQIIRMAQDFSDLSKVAGHIGANQKVLPAQALNVRESIKSSAYDIRRTFERMCRDEASYVRESARITEGKALNESKENIADIVEALQALLSVGGVAMDETVLETVAKRVGFTEDMRPDSNPPDNAQDPDTGKAAQIVKPTQPVKPGQATNQVGDGDQADGNDGDDDDGHPGEDQPQENGGFHESAVAETLAIREFDSWMNEFDPDLFFSEGKSFKRNKDEDADDKKKQDKQRRDDQKGKQERTDEAQSIAALEAKLKKLKKEHADCDDFPSARHDLADEIKTVEAALKAAKSLDEGKSFKRNKDEDAADKKKQDKQRRDTQKGKNDKPVEEGKSFKRNKDEDAAEKKKQDKQRRDDQKTKKERMDESIIDNIDDDFEPDPDWVYDNEDEIIADVHRCISMARANPGMMQQLAYKAQKGIRALDLAGFSPMDVVDLEDPTVQAMGISESLQEGKSFKRNKDEDADDKKKQDKQRRDNQRGKNDPVEESSLLKKWLVTYDDKVLGKFAKPDEAIAFAHQWETKTLAAKDPSVKFYFDDLKVQTRDGRLYWDAEYGGPNFDPLEEGKSYKRNKDEDAADKKKQDKQRRDTQRGKNEPVEEGKSYKRNRDEDADDKKKQDKDRRDSSKNKKVPVTESVNGLFEAYGVIGAYNRPFRKTFKSVAERAEWLGNQAIVNLHGLCNPRLIEGKSFKRNDDDESAADKKKKDQQKRDAAKKKQERTDEASDISFNDAKREIKLVKGKLAKMSPFDKDYRATKAYFDKLTDRLARNGDDDMDESVQIDEFSDMGDGGSGGKSYYYGSDGSSIHVICLVSKDVNEIFDIADPDTRDYFERADINTIMDNIAEFADNDDLDTRKIISELHNLTPASYDTVAAVFRSLGRSAGTDLRTFANETNTVNSLVVDYDDDQYKSEGSNVNESFKSKKS